MSSRQIQIVVGLLIVFAVGIALVMLASNNREKLAIQMEAEKSAALAEAKEGTVNAEAAASDKTVKPSFDVARFEPTGDGVVAGLAKPGASVELLANGEPIASTSANDVGEWVIVLEKPLKPGNYDLSLKATMSEAEASLSEEFIAVMIPESSTGDVLVVASRPGQASEILARPQAAAKPEADAVQVAAADTKEGAAAGTGAELKPTAEPLENPAEGAKVAGSEIEQPSEATGTEARPMADGTAGTVAANGSETVEQAASGDAGPVGEVAETTETTTDETVIAATPPEAGDVQQTSQDMAAASAESQADETPVADSAGTDIDTSTGSEAAIVAVETASPAVTAKTDVQKQETQTASATDTVPNDAADPSIAVAKPADNTMTADKPAEQMEGDSGASVEMDVAATAPEAAPGTPEATDETVKEIQVAKTENIAVPLPEEPSAMEKPRPVVPLVLDAVETEGDMVYAAGTGNSGTTVRVYVDDSYIGETVTGDDGRWLLETPASIAAGNVIVRADELEIGNAEVVRRAEVPFVKQADAVALLPTSATGGGGASETSSAEAVAGPKSIIIRSGDNLWTISRRTYGRGIRYTTIYNANDDQIRNPHMIFPGQVFVLPEGDRSWTQ